MSFPRYPEYKDSGVKWLGKVPGHWNICALKRIADLKSGESITAEDIEEDGEFPVFGGNGLRGFTTRYTHEGTYALIGRQGALCGNINYATGKFWASEHAVVATPKFPVETHWLGELMRAMNLNQYSVSAAQPGLSVEIVGNLRIPVPTADEQTAIATFLDHETAKIDALVAEQEKLIALLQEKRQAVISHAVTKGLNPNAPMKDSGVEWLGEVPAHWAVGKCGFYLRILSGFAFPSSGFTDDDSAHRLLRGANVGVSRLKWDDTMYWQRSEGDGLDDYEMVEGDLVIGMDRPLIGEGMRVAKVTAEDLPSLLLQRVASLKVGNMLHADYLHYLLASEMFIAHFSPETTGVSVPHISPDQIKKFIIPIPPMSEQLAIVKDVKRLLTEFGGLVAESEIAITLLQERRTALISAAVTGQIDVRGWVPAGDASNFIAASVSAESVGG